MAIRATDGKLVRRELLIIARERLDLYERLQRLPPHGSVVLVFDRRVVPTVPRIPIDRRVRDISAALATSGYAIVEALDE